MANEHRAAAWLRPWISLAALAWSAPGCADAGPEPGPQLDDGATTYLEVALALAEHDPNFIVSYFGPPELRTAAAARQRSLAQIATAARAAAASIDAVATGDDPLAGRRKAFLQAQLGAVAERADMLGGKLQPFMEEARRVYGAVIPEHELVRKIVAIHRRIERIVPGTGSLAKRIEAFQARFAIPPDRLDAVIAAAIAECRRRTLAAIELPPESLTYEFVSDVPWLTFNEFEGNGFTRISINGDVPMRIERAVDMGCHDGYPGHHVSNVLKERDLVEGRGWIEFSLQTLYSPQTLVEEGLASYAVDLIFPPDERLEFERDVLFELAGFDRAQAHRYLELMALIGELVDADIEAARRYLDGDWSASRTVRWLVDYRLVTASNARQRLKVFETYRTFIAAGPTGERLVRSYVARQTGSAAGQTAWEILRELLVAPTLPSELAP